MPDVTEREVIAEFATTLFVALVEREGLDNVQFDDLESFAVRQMKCCLQMAEGALAAKSEYLEESRHA